MARGHQSPLDGGEGQVDAVDLILAVFDGGAVVECCDAPHDCEDCAHGDVCVVHEGIG